MAWVNHRKAYDFVPHSWINECLKLFGVAENVREFLKTGMENRKFALTSNGEDMGDVPVKRGIFQGDSLSPLVFFLCMIPLSLVLRKTKAFHEWGNRQFQLNHLLFMDDLVLFAKNEKDIDSLVNTAHIFSTDIGLELGLKKCGVLVLKRGKVVRCEGIKLRDRQVMNEVEEDGYTYLGVVELHKIREDEMKEKLTSEKKRRLRLIPKSQLNGGNETTAINTRVFSILRYGASIIEWREPELKTLDRKTRKIMTMYEERRELGLINADECAKGDVNSLRWYIKWEN